MWDNSGNFNRGGYGNRSYGNNGYGNNGYNRGGYNRGNYGGGGYNKPQPKKKSGASFRTMEDGAHIVSAWFVRKRQLYKVYARPYKGTKERTSKSGKVWENLFVTITNMDSMQSQNTSGLFDVQGKRLYMKDFNLIATNKGKGGYCGRHMGGNK